MRATLAVLLLTTVAHAQPAPQSAWWRITLKDGRVIDALVVGGDDKSYFVQTAQGTFSIAKDTVASTTPVPQPPPQPVPAYVPPQPQPLRNDLALAPPAEEPPAKANKRMQGLAGAVGMYTLTALVVLGRRDDDPDARLGLIPIVGPTIWASTDDDKFGEDGYDWLALLDGFFQGASIALMLYPDDDQPAKKSVSIRAHSSTTFSGVSIGGSF